MCVNVCADTIFVDDIAKADQPIKKFKKYLT